MTNIDQIRHPSHYTASAAGFKVECITLTRSMGFAPGNAVKYVWRHRDKGTAALDLGKTEQYLEWCIEHQLPAHSGVSQTRLVNFAHRILAESDVAANPGVYGVIPLICDAAYDGALEVVRAELAVLEYRQMTAVRI